MRRAIWVSILLHGTVFVLLSLWLSVNIQRPADGPVPTLNVRISPVEDSNRAAEPRESSSAHQMPERPAADPGPQPERALAALLTEAALPAREPVASPNLSPQTAPAAPPLPGPDSDAPATTTRVKQVMPQESAPDPGTRAQPVAGRPSATQTAARVQPARSVPLSSAQRRMMDKKLKRWAQELADVESRQPTTWSQGEQRYTASFTTLAAAGEMGIERVLVEISTQENGTRLSTELRMRRLAFSNFAQFVDRWDPGVQIHDDELDGRFHSNSEISVLYDRHATPTFTGKVTTASRRINTANSKGRSRRDAIFQGGLETGVRRITLPKRFLPFPTADQRSSGHHFDHDARITFYPDGRYSWQYLDSVAAEQRGQLGEQPTYLIARNKARLYVKGTVKGKVLLHSPERIVIEDDLVYADHPHVDPDSGNFLGLVSDKSVEIAEPAVTGPGDLHINAAIYARRRFIVRRYRAREHATLTIYGSLTAGSVSATEPRYATRIRFDQRLEDLRPPGFPMSDRYELETWDGQWTAAAEP